MSWVAYTKQDEPGELCLIAHAVEEGYAATLNRILAEDQPDLGTTGASIQTGKVCKVNPIRTEPGLVSDHLETMQGGYTASIALPLLKDGKAFGALTIYAEQPYSFDEQEESHLQELTDDLVYGIFALRTRATHQQVEEALQTSEARLRSLIEHIPAVVYTEKDDDGLQLYISPQVEALSGYTQTEWIENSALWKDMIHADDLMSVLAEDKRTRGCGDPFQVEYRIRTKDGRTVWLRDEAVQVRDTAGKPLLWQGFMLDITKIKQAEEQIRKSAADVEANLNKVKALRKIDIVISNTLDLQKSIDVILEQVTTLLDVDAACLLLFDSYSQTLKFALGRGFRTDALRYTNLQVGESYAGQAALQRQIIRIADLRNGKTNLLRSPMLALEGFIAYYAIPLVAKGEVKGVLEIFHRTLLEPDPEWLDFLETLAGQAAIAIDNASLFTELQNSNRNLIQAYDATIAGWSRALELRDRETQGHTQRVTVMSTRLARSMGVSEAELVHMRRGAMLHDIGKMAIPDQILLKPGPLTEDEWTMMRKHPVFAYEMLASIPYLKQSIDIPYYHHERWDGAGYPNGLIGVQIPIAARIFAVVDVWDALTSDRPYRAAWTIEKALDYIRQQSENHFDPSVVKAFLKQEEIYQAKQP
jgi:PAS domain S-box-containing protein/putative nucleotidyltransferase with HDIG domain